jgi:hypothetical protein
MKHLFIGYIVLCTLLQIYFYSNPGDVMIWGILRQKEWFVRDLLWISATGISPCIAFIPEQAIRKKLAWALIIQASCAVFSLFYDDLTYSAESLLLQALALTIAIYLIYKPKKK